MTISVVERRPHRTCTGMGEHWWVLSRQCAVGTNSITYTRWLGRWLPQLRSLANRTVPNPFNSGSTSRGLPIWKQISVYPPRTLDVILGSRHIFCIRPFSQSQKVHFSDDIWKSSLTRELHISMRLLFFIDRNELLIWCGILRRFLVDEEYFWAGTFRENSQRSIPVSKVFRQTLEYLPPEKQ